ncbi:MAG: hypothetical protein K2O93_01600 [Oscillospiraceae bacterium]|nr:hypothetical protein [Oscillospiraceae bacterium]
MDCHAIFFPAIVNFSQDEVNRFFSLVSGINRHIDIFKFDGTPIILHSCNRFILVQQFKGVVAVRLRVIESFYGLQRELEFICINFKGLGRGDGFAKQQIPVAPYTAAMHRGIVVINFYCCLIFSIISCLIVGMRCEALTDSGLRWRAVFVVISLVFAPIKLQNLPIPLRFAAAQHLIADNARSCGEEVHRSGLKSPFI